MVDATSDREELVYAAAIVILADDLYPRKLEIIREYIQNASDALDAFGRIADHIDDDSKPVIKISIHGKSLLIWDNGIGMDAEEAQKLRRIAYSEKRVGQEAGYKGIGRLAGIAVAKKLVISSTTYGDPKLHRFEFRAGDLHDELSDNRRKGIQEAASLVINRHTTISSLDVDPAEHHTMVELRDIDDRYADLLDPTKLRGFIGDIAPVGFPPDFTHGQRITDNLYKYLPDYSPKDIWLTMASGERTQIYKPYNDAMRLAEPEFIEVYDPQDGQRLLGYCWCATKGKEILGKIRPSGRKFTVEGDKAEDKKRLTGLAYKLVGFTIGDRNLPLHTLWAAKDYTRALWYTGEIHIVDREIKPTTDRSNFIDNEVRNEFYKAAQRRIAKRLNTLAQDVSNNRKAFDIAEKYRARFEELQQRLQDGGIEKAELNARKRDLREAEQNLKRKVGDRDIKAFVSRVAQEGRALQKRLETTKSQKNKTNEINDLARDLDMTSHARKVYTIVMETLENYFRDDMDTYYELAGEIKKAIKKRY